MVPLLASALTSPNTPVWITAALVLLDLAVKVAALGFIPQNRRPSSAMAWLLLVYLIPFVGLLLFFMLGQHDGRPRPAPDPSRGQRLRARAVLLGRVTADRRGGAEVAADVDHDEPEPRHPAVHLGQPGRAVLRLRGVDRGDDRRGREGRSGSSTSSTSSWPGTTSPGRSSRPAPAP